MAGAARALQARMAAVLGAQEALKRREPDALYVLRQALVDLAAVAELVVERGANAVQVQRWLGHHSAAFTLATYVHLLDSGVGEPLDLSAELGQAGDQGSERLREFSRSATFCS
jgi:integrase